MERIFLICFSHFQFLECMLVFSLVYFLCTWAMPTLGNKISLIIKKKYGTKKWEGAYGNMSSEINIQTAERYLRYYTSSPTH